MRYLRRWPKVEYRPDSQVPPARESEGEGRGGGRWFGLGRGEAWAGPVREERRGEGGGLLQAEMERGREGAHEAFFHFEFLFIFPDLICIV